MNLVLMSYQVACDLRRFTKGPTGRHKRVKRMSLMDIADVVQSGKSVGHCDSSTFTKFACRTAKSYLCDNRRGPLSALSSRW